jgi:hypothetical protein
LRASIVFDDPNLRRPSYGFIDYRRLLAHADAHGYHAVVAMIPLDGTRTHREAAALFSGRPDRLSLAVHGNDHVRRELAVIDDRVDALETAGQAMHRIARFERRSGVAVDRVMVPPHGMCSEPMTAALGAVGFDALCAIHPLPWTEDPPPEERLVGWNPAQFAGGCAVIPRFPLTTSPTEVALRAFLDQPLVWYGHHDDLAEGLEPLERAAAMVNRLGSVQWQSLGGLARSNAAQRLDEGRLTVRPYARRLRVQPPEAASRLVVEEPSGFRGRSELVAWSVGGGVPVAFGQGIGIPPSGSIEIRLHGAADVEPGALAAPRWRPWRRLRRITTETRDRAVAIRRVRLG